MGLRILTHLTINTHKCPYWYVYAKLPALILGEDDLKKKGNLGLNPEEREREGTERKERGVDGLLDAAGWDLKTV